MDQTGGIIKLKIYEENMQNCMQKIVLKVMLQFQN